MEQPRQDLTGRLLRAVQDLPDDKIGEAIDFVEYLQAKYGQRQPPRGSAEGIAKAFAEFGPLEFEPGEFDALLADMERSRWMSLTDEELTLLPDEERAQVERVLHG
jgi:hypothetical protein